ncbi:YceK/YidQ family lipoprotein [Muribacter muris]|uniref:YceK/YidQ family lipoprotein n=1 Tax=Muribacter muris TaxID=67855 RepID=A0A4Y9JSY0_9PAST|nr:YceK/YidQ family lipoprotein [Muribacter muris]MBF0785692.1 YceK/YidQ family lipoprotein [Muribacter muris]MBF0827727.1 YceK/YidQ family lipoprotein [Muribacter muris]TFV08811.1 YceK/YidQ family lipoprotein [Muribacter muris]
MKKGNAKGIKWLKRGIFATLVLQLTACGTVISFAENDYRVYGGVRRDFQAIQEGSVLGVLAVVDLPLSFVMDTLALPVTLSRD